MARNVLRGGFDVAVHDVRREAAAELRADERVLFSTPVEQRWSAAAR